MVEQGGPQVTIYRHLEKDIQQHKDDITKGLNSNSRILSFDSALSSHIFDNTSHKMLFEDNFLISNDLGINR